MYAAGEWKMAWFAQRRPRIERTEIVMIDKRFIAIRHLRVEPLLRPATQSPRQATILPSQGLGR